MTAASATGARPPRADERPIGDPDDDDADFDEDVDDDDDEEEDDEEPMQLARHARVPGGHVGC